MIVDGDFVFVGIVNMDMCSFQFNFEVNVFFMDVEVICIFEDYFEEDMLDSEKFSFVGFYKRGMIDWIKEFLVCLFLSVL